MTKLLRLCLQNKHGHSSGVAKTSLIAPKQDDGGTAASFDSTTLGVVESMTEPLRIHPWYLDLGLRFFQSPLLKEILIFYQIDLRISFPFPSASLPGDIFGARVPYKPISNLNSNNDIESLGISCPEFIDKAFRIILAEHYSWRCLITSESMGAMPLQTYFNYPILDPEWVDAKIAKLPPASQTTEDAPKASSSGGHQDKVLETVDLTFLVEEGHQQPSIVSGGEGRESSFKKDGRLSDILPEQASLIVVQKQPPQSNNSNCSSKVHQSWTPLCWSTIHCLSEPISQPYRLPVHSSKLLPLNGSSLHNAKYVQALARSAVSPANFREANAWTEVLLKGSADKILKLKTAYKCELSNMIKSERSSLGRAFKAKEEAEQILASERSSWDVDRSILQLYLDAARLEVDQSEKFQMEILQQNE
ncbi:hypothetical protein D8674_011559 [Pyrus ussuriensis x Pyrus communis]|uniref:Uncharacterized protein n=1 Tax=Pyrus ussuriensis x Pyrus communis TaxID=2448454 RepID=A0A5N5G3P2_9ROSA|nr:hypothetical protein D8674_011559 [Pyrus ussuriensis x Pyrus communis]